MTTATIESGEGWLRNRQFDSVFILGIAALALSVGIVVTLHDRLFGPVLALNLWLLGYHHVVATYTRLAFDADSFREHRALVLHLPVAIGMVVLAANATAGAWLITTVYLYWQWWHYTRQSEGIAKAYGYKGQDKRLASPKLARFAFWAVPVAGILTVSAKMPTEFLFGPLKTLPVPPGAVPFLQSVAAVAVLAWAFEQYRAWRVGRLAVPYVLYTVSHFAVYTVAYVLIDAINHGWLVINVWHNAQYIGFVWHYNNRRFGGRSEREHLFLSTLSQNGWLPLYLLFGVTASTALYLAIDGLSLYWRSLIAPIVVYQTINFHHYVVDARIWKLRKRPIQVNLGLT
jgi:hypothetical protein